MKFRALSALMIALAVSACIPRAENKPSKPVRTGSRPPMMRPVPVDTRQCLADLDAMNANYTLIPNENYGSGCSLNGAVQLLGAGIPVTNVRAIRCGMARNVALWLRETVQPAARQAFGSPIARLESMGAYSCRNIVGNPAVAGNRSEHATGNAIDIGGFVLADGRRVTVKAGWNGSADERSFMRAVRKGACGRFQTVLSPDYNAAHHDHLHFDLGKGPYCR